MTHYHFFQLPRGNNPGGPIHHTLPHTITVCQWHYNCFLIQQYE